MIHLFVLDIDGCISHPFETPNWDAISRIRELNLKSRDDQTIPSLTLCTGRPLPYAEAVAQWLDIRSPFVFESALLYYPTSQRILTPYGHWPVNRNQSDQRINHSGEKQESESVHDPTEQIRTFRNWLTEELIPKYPDAIPEFTKMIDAGVISSNKKVIDQIYREIIKAREELFPELEVHRTEVSVNTLPAGSNKSTGFKLISGEYKLALSKMAYIGDSEADIGPLKQVRMPFAPSNAIQAVRDAAEALAGETSEAVLEAYERIIDYNRNSG